MAKTAKDFGLELSNTITKRNIKIMLWGKTGTRKTELPLRTLPHVLVIDTEGNTDQCIDVPEIPNFLRIKTKDTRKIMELLDAVAEGQVKFPDGSPVETLVIDSWTVVWSVQQEVASANAEARASRKGWTAETATVTQLDWGIAKRPMKKISNRLNGSAVKFLVLVAREKDLYKEQAPGKEDQLVKIGVQPDCVKGTEYDMNVALHLQYDASAKWFYEVSKVQGGLARLFPMGKPLYTFPTKELLEYASSIKPEALDEKDETEIAQEIAEETNEPRTQPELIKFAESQGVAKNLVGAVLKEAGFNGFEPSRWEEMKAAVIVYASAHELKAVAA